MNSAANLAANLIREYDPACAAAFISNPFHRFALARAFAKGLRNDVHEVGQTILSLVELDLLERQEARGV